VDRTVILIPGFFSLRILAEMTKKGNSPEALPVVPQVRAFFSAAQDPWTPKEIERVKANKVKQDKAHFFENITHLLSGFSATYGINLPLAERQR